MVIQKRRGKVVRIMDEMEMTQLAFTSGKPHPNQFLKGAKRDVYNLRSELTKNSQFRPERLTAFALWKEP